MKSIILSSVVTALLFFSGCSSSEPIVDETANQEQVAQEVEAVDTETVSEENSDVVNSNSMSSAESNSLESADSNEMTMATLEQELSSIYFDFDQFNIRADMQDKIANSSRVANNEANSYTVKLEGNCDEWGSDEYNFALGLKRANSVKNSLIAEGVDASRITMVSYGESNPTCNDKTKDCWSKNRRVDFKLLP